MIALNWADEVAALWTPVDEANVELRKGVSVQSIELQAVAPSNDRERVIHVAVLRD